MTRGGKHASQEPTRLFVALRCMVWNLSCYLTTAALRTGTFNVYTSSH